VSAGHIRRRSAGSWELKFEAGVDPTTGKRKTAYRSFKGTKREAQAELVRLLGEASRGALVDVSKETLGQFLAPWDRDWAAHNVSPKTRERQQQLTANQILPRLGGAPIQGVKPAHLAEFYATLMREGGAAGGPLAPRTVGHAHRLLRRAFGHAQEWGLIQSNPAAVARPPRVPDAEIEIATEAEISLVLERLQERAPQLHTLATLALATGARRGELCALLWRDHDPSAGTLRIERSLETTRDEGHSGSRRPRPGTGRGRSACRRRQSRRFAPTG
jgi:integrase